MSSKNKGADQLRGYSRGGLCISFRTYKKGFTISLYSLWEEKTYASIRKGKDLSFILHRQKTCIRGFRPGLTTARLVCKALKDLNVVISGRSEERFYYLGSDTYKLVS